MSSGVRTPVAVNITAAGQPILVAAPGVGYSISVLSVHVAAMSAGTFKFQEGTSGSVGAVLVLQANTNDCVALIVPWKVATNTAFTVNTTSTSAWVTVQYYISVT